MTMLAVRPTMVYNILRYCTGSNLWTNWSQELGDIEICVALCMSVGAGRGNFPDPQLLHCAHHTLVPKQQRK